MIEWLQDKYSDRPDYKGHVLEYPVWHPQAFSCDFETVYASVWTGDRIEDVDVGAGGYSNWTYWGRVEVDATDEARQLADQWKKKVQRELAEWTQMVNDWSRATTISVGDYVERISGRKPPIGTKGRVEFIGQTAYGESVKVDGVWGGKPHTWRKILGRDYVDPLLWQRIQRAIERLDSRTIEVYAKHRYRIVSSA